MLVSAAGTRHLHHGALSFLEEEQRGAECVPHLPQPDPTYERLSPSWSAVRSICDRADPRTVRPCRAQRLRWAQTRLRSTTKGRTSSCLRQLWSQQPTQPRLMSQRIKRDSSHWSGACLPNKQLSELYRTHSFISFLVTKSSLPRSSTSPLPAVQLHQPSPSTVNARPSSYGPLISLCRPGPGRLSTQAAARQMR